VDGQAIEAGTVVGCFGMKAKSDLVDWLRVKVASPQLPAAVVAADRVDEQAQATSQTPAVVVDPPVADSTPEGSENPSECDTPLPASDARESLTVYGDLEADPNFFGVNVNDVAKPLSSPTAWMFIKAMLPAVHGRPVIESYVRDAVKKMKGRKDDYGPDWAKGQAFRSSEALASADSKFTLHIRTTNGTPFVVWMYGTEGITDQNSA